MPQPLVRRAGYEVLKREEFKNYVLTMTRSSSGHAVVLAISIRFNFVSGKYSRWESEDEKRAFMHGWEVAVERKWNSASLYTSPTKGRVSFAVNVLASYENEAPRTKWTLTVSKALWDDFETSSVNDALLGGNTSVADSNDLRAISKLGPGHPTQRAAVHEFGHMIGLDDEYPDEDAWVEWKPHKDDLTSIMHRGEVVWARHLEVFRRWAKAALGE